MHSRQRGGRLEHIWIHGLGDLRVQKRDVQVVKPIRIDLLIPGAWMVEEWLRIETAGHEKDCILRKVHANGMLGLQEALARGALQEGLDVLQDNPLIDDLGNV
eukprot:7648423-Pyramimonas_sp.AAC.1